MSEQVAANQIYAIKTHPVFIQTWKESQTHTTEIRMRWKICFLEFLYGSHVRLLI